MSCKSRYNLKNEYIILYKTIKNRFSRIKDIKE